MDSATVAVRHRAQRKAITQAARRAMLREWRTLDDAAIRASYATTLPRFLAILTAAQARAASDATAYLDAALKAQGADSPDVLAQVNSRAFAGVASDGRDLLSLLQSPLFQTMAALGQGASPGQALAIGGSVLDRITATQTIDAGRTADGVGIAASTGVVGYERIAAPPCCGRCAILGGQFYKWSTGFERHPYCDCFHVPVLGRGRSSGLGQSAMELFKNGQIRGMSQADIRAVREGADLNKVINARRGMSTAARRNAGGRMMPEQIYRESRGNREHCIALLRANGFIL